MINQGTILIKLENVSFTETERPRQIIHKLFESGVFSIRNGKAILNFDNYGILADIEVSMKTWSRKYENDPQIILKPLSQFKIEMAPNESNVVIKS